VSLVERVWFGHAASDAALRLGLLPAEALYRLTVAARGALYDRGVLRVERASVPVLSVGNLSAGGTGKTPMAAWVARRLADAGAAPAIVMRGYGADEPLVHQQLNPDVPVVTSPDRAAGARRAVQGGADCIVLDDAFQHRRLARDVDVVLLSADRWSGGERLLPAGPWREPFAALARASLVVVTRKAADHGVASDVAQAMGRWTKAPVAVVALELGLLQSNGGEPPIPAEDLLGRRVLAVSAIGDPQAFRRQLEARGAVVRTAEFSDHHRFTTAEADRLAHDAAADEIVVCTLKDYVKLAPSWPRAAKTLWYVSQRVVPESGMSAIDDALDTVLTARNS
jgi:tetraacyldisaccharide 4'-kinase